MNSVNKGALSNQHRYTQTGKDWAFKTPNTKSKNAKRKAKLARQERLARKIKLNGG